MSQITTTKTFAAGNRVTHTDLNQIISLATLNPTTYTGALQGTDNLLFLRGAVLGINTYSAVMQNADSLTVKPLAGNRYAWVSGGANLLLMEAAGTTLFPIQCVNGAASNSLYLSSAGVGVLNSAPGYALDVTGVASATTLQCYTRGTGDAPQVIWRDNDAPAGVLATMYMEPSTQTLYIERRAFENTANGVNPNPIVLATAAPSNSLVLTSAGRLGIGTASPSEALGVVGNIAASGSVVASNVTASGVFYQDTSPGLTGTLVVTGTWNGGGSGSRTLSFKGGILTGVT